MKRDLTTAAVGGGIGGLLDCIYATVVWGFVLGSDPIGVWQSVAAGVLGKASYQGGYATAALGLALHFFIAFAMALAYVLASRRLRALTSRPWLMGMLYGALLFVVMNFVVVPLSAIGFHAPKLMSAIRAIIPHVLLVGPAISLVTARRAMTPRMGSRPTS